MHAYGGYAETKSMPYYALNILYVKASPLLPFALKSSSQDHCLIV